MLLIESTGAAGAGLGASCGFLGDSCGCAEATGRDADDALEVMGELALIREADTRGNLDERQVGLALEKLSRPFDATGDDVLVWCQSRGRLEPARKVVGAEMRRLGHSRQGEAVVEVILDVLDDRAQRTRGQRTVSWTPKRGGRAYRADQLPGRVVGERLGGQPPATGAGCHLRVYCPHCRPEMGQVDAVERTHGEARRVEVEFFGGDPCEHLGRQEDVQVSLGVAGTNSDWAAGRD